MLQIRRGKQDNSGIVMHVSSLNLFCDPPLESSQRDGSNEGSQYMFSLRNKEKLSSNYLQYPLLSGSLVCLITFDTILLHSNYHHKIIGSTQNFPEDCSESTFSFVYSSNVQSTFLCCMK